MRVLTGDPPEGKTQAFAEDWSEWVKVNVRRGCSRDEMFRILLDNGFEYELVAEQLDHRPKVDIETIVNPLLRTPIQHEEWEDPLRSSTGIFVPTGRRAPAGDVELHQVENFLNEDECAALVSLIGANPRPSALMNSGERGHQFRASCESDLSRTNDQLAHAIDERICRFLGVNPSYSESIQGQYYDVGNEFRAHTDYLEDDELQRFAGKKGQRTWTVMIYLNDTESGGETRFPRLNLTFRPKRGSALMWNNLRPDGRPNPDTVHQEMPVRSGFKAIVTKWFREKGEGSMVVREDNERLPVYSLPGFLCDEIPQKLFDALRSFYVHHLSELREEHVPGFISGDRGAASELVPLTDALKRETHETLQKRVERWCGVAIRPTYVYGIRRYGRSAVLKPHRDRLGTHVFGAILNIEQQVDVEWPLTIEDHLCRVHDVSLRPGQMVLYESGRLIHGRPKPLEGDSYSNVFVHYRPKRDTGRGCKHC